MLKEVIKNGKALLENLKNLFRAQGGDESVIDDVSKLPKAKTI